MRLLLIEIETYHSLIHVYFKSIIVYIIYVIHSYSQGKLCEFANFEDTVKVQSQSNFLGTFRSNLVDFMKIKL